MTERATEKLKEAKYRVGTVADLLYEIALILLTQANRRYAEENGLPKKGEQKT